MIFPPELQRFIYILDDNPRAIEALVRYCDSLVNPYNNPDTAIRKAFALDSETPKLEKVD